MARVIVAIREDEPSPAMVDAIRRGWLAGLLWFRSAFGIRDASGPGGGSGLRGASGPEVEAAAERVARLRAIWPPGVPCLFAIDEEGGLIQQLCGLVESSGSVWPRLPSPRALGRGDDPRLAFAHGREIGRRLRRLGLDLALAPVVDLDPGPESAVLGTRCFAADPDRVTDIALHWLRGLASAGVRGCVKHFPGHGATQVDSHQDLPYISARTDFRPHREPYDRIAQAWRSEDGPPPAVLTAHIVCEPSRLPASLDADALRELPAGLGPILSDSLDMAALRPFGDLKKRGQAALEAGSDLLIVGLDVEAGLALARSVGEPSALKLDAWKAADPLPPIPEPWDPQDLMRAAEAGLRLLRDVPIPPGDWDWILPVGFGPYGAVADPPEGIDGRRRIARVVRYRQDDADSLAQALLAGGRERPALVAWAHRGPPDATTTRCLRAAGPRVRAVAHILDGAAPELLPGAWCAETCGFGEGEMAALARRWCLAAV